MAMVRAALTQTTWTGDKESMLDKHEQFARDAAAQGAQIICFQELFYGPYFCQVQDTQYYDYTEPIPDGPTTQRWRKIWPISKRKTRSLSSCWWMLSSNARTCKPPVAGCRARKKNAMIMSRIWKRRAATWRRHCSH